MHIHAGVCMNMSTVVLYLYMHMFQSSRGSLSEDVLVNELTRPGLFGNLEDTESNEVENQQNPISFHPNSPKVCT